MICASWFVCEYDEELNDSEDDIGRQLGAGESFLGETQVVAYDGGKIAVFPTSRSVYIQVPVSIRHRVASLCKY